VPTKSWWSWLFRRDGSGLLLVLTEPGALAAAERGCVILASLFVDDGHGRDVGAVLRPFPHGAPPWVEFSSPPY